MRLLLFIVTALAVLQGCEPSSRPEPTGARSDVPLWQGTSSGMSVEAVRSVLPAATPPLSSPGRLFDGSVELLRLEGFALLNRTFTASFYFLESRLTQVTLSLDNPETFDAELHVFDALIVALRAKYGTELSRSVNRAGVLNIAEAEWLVGRTNLSLYFFGSEPARLTLHYQSRLAKEVDKL